MCRRDNAHLGLLTLQEKEDEDEFGYAAHEENIRYLTISFFVVNFCFFCGDAVIGEHIER